jgi:uncharacterized NAD-dependent epimerase/dehydratase family protein
VTLALLHGAAPSALVLCHHAGREAIRPPLGARRAGGEPVIPPLAELVHAYESAAAWVTPARVVALALNTLGLGEAEARAAIAAATRETGLPACDPVRFGAEPIADALLRHAGERRRHAPAS